MPKEIDQFLAAIRAYIDGETEHYEFGRRMNEMLRATEALYLGAAGGPIMEINGILNTYVPSDDPPMALWIKMAVADQAAALDALGEVEILRANTADQVISSLASDDPGIRVWAAYRAEAFPNDAEVMAALRARLGDPDPKVSRMAAYYLGRIGDVASVESIGALLGEDLTRPWRHEIAALKWLAERGDDEVAARVITILEAYLQDGGAAVSQTTHLLAALRSRHS